MRIKLIFALVLFCAASLAGAGEIRASLLDKIQLAEHAAPADAVLESDGAFGVYDAFEGAYTIYRGGKAEQTVKRNYLKGGNCFVKNGNYYFYCNSADNRLDMLSGGFDLYQSFSLPSGMKGKYDPTDALAAGGYVFSVDNDNHRIIKTDITSKEVELAVGSYGSERLNFWFPYSITSDSKGVLYVSEVLNTRVQKLTTDLKFYEFYGKWGVNPGEFYRPTGIAIYKGSTLFVGDGYTGVVQYLDGDGKFSGVLKDKSGKKLEFGSVTHIRISGNRLAVVDAFNKAVYIYELGEEN